MCEKLVCSAVLENMLVMQHTLLTFVDDIYEDLELLVVVDKNLISSRTPRDLAPFAKAMLDFLLRVPRLRGLK